MINDLDELQRRFEEKYKEMFGYDFEQVETFRASMIVFGAMLAWELAGIDTGIMEIHEFLKVLKDGDAL